MTIFNSGLLARSLMLIGLSLTFLNTAIAQEGMSREEVIDSLRRAVAALETIDRPDDARRVAELLDQYVRGDRRQDRARPGDRGEPVRPDEREGSDRPRVGDRERPRDGDRDRPRDGDFNERELAEQQIDKMRMALDALARDPNRDAIEKLERAIAARVYRLQGNRNEEARRTIERAPSREAEIDLLLLAKRSLEQQDRMDAADAVWSLVLQLSRPWDADRKQPDRERSDRQRLERERPERDAIRRDEEMREREMREREMHEREMRDRENARVNENRAREREREAEMVRQREMEERRAREIEAEQQRAQLAEAREKVLVQLRKSEFMLRDLQLKREQMEQEMNRAMEALERQTIELRERLEQLDPDRQRR